MPVLFANRDLSWYDGRHIKIANDLNISGRWGDFEDIESYCEDLETQLEMCDEEVARLNRELDQAHRDLDLLQPPPV